MSKAKEPAIICIAIRVCEQCIRREPGMCHMPGCLFIRWKRDELPYFLEAENLPGQDHAVLDEAKAKEWEEITDGNG